MTWMRQLLSDHLYTPGQPDPDLFIRTGGENRLSNFLLWQLSYAELYFTEIKWPDFGREEFLEAMTELWFRQRRFGKTGASSEGVSHCETSCTRPGYDSTLGAAPHCRVRRSFLAVIVCTAASVCVNITG